MPGVDGQGGADAKLASETRSRVARKGNGYEYRRAADMGDGGIG